MSAPQLKSVAFRQQREDAWQDLEDLIDKIERTPVVGGGDRTLKARARDLRGCNFLRQLDWLHSAWWYDTRAAWEARQEREG